MSPFRRCAAALMLAAVAVVASAAPASAHDQLIVSTPSDGEQLAAAPSSVSLTFSGELLVLDDASTGAVVLVVDASGTDWVTGAVTVSGSEVTAELTPDMPVGGYQVRWQVVSEDGHPVSGVIPFAVGDAAPMVAPSRTDTGGAPSADAPTVTSDQIADESSGALRMLLVGGIGAAVAVLLLVIIRIVRRPRTAAATPETGDSAEHL